MEGSTRTPSGGISKTVASDLEVIRMWMRSHQLRTVLWPLVGLVLSCLPLSSLPASPQATPTAKEENKKQLETLVYSVKGPDLFRAHCAPCHGLDAKGSGPLASALKTRPANLTVLAKNNGGQFPTVRVRSTIIGDDVLTSHGSREMPIWGPIFHQIEWDQDLGNVRLQNLVKYLEFLQQK